ncbi:MAG: epoxyqueuosine reductase [Gammaproteobacteria bacterium]|jgi:epoxyqueuosine reductase
MKPVNPPPVEHLYTYHKFPRSGNDINGLGKTEKFRPRKIAPDDFTIVDYDYKQKWDFFFYTMSWPVFKTFILGMFESRKATGPVARIKIEVDDRQAMAEEIKKKAIEFGGGVVGITLAEDDLLLYEDEEPYPYKYAICIGTPQDRKIMEQVPQTVAGHEVVNTYRKSSNYTNSLAAHIRSLGWPAEAFALGRDILQIPSAIQAGLGELGKHGSLINREYGSNFRLTMVLTDLPMTVDEPVDIGVQDVCATCQACTKYCPPGAISDKKAMVRGVEKWYVDYDLCSWYFVKTTGCSICVEVCPWSSPDRGFKLSEIMLTKREKTIT